MDTEALDEQAVATGRHAVLRRWRETYDAADMERAGELVARVGLGPLAQRAVGRLSDGERDGRVREAGALEEVLTDEAVSAAFGMGRRVHRHGERWAVTAGG